MPLSTLSKLKIKEERIQKNSICVRGFDGGSRDSFGDIVLELTIGPVEFTMEFQVLDITVSYNLLLGRPWIHAAKAVPSTLHQAVKFEWDHQEVVVYGEESLNAHSSTIVPVEGPKNDQGPWVYQVTDTVSIEKIPEGKYLPNPKISSASVMVAYEMLKNGFIPGKGLGLSSQGIIQPVSLPENWGTFGLGFIPTANDVIRARKLKHQAWVLPKPVPHLSKSFVKTGAKNRPITTIPKSRVNPEKELIERFEKLFSDVNMLESGEGCSNAEVQFVGPETKLNNWKATPLPIRKESW